MKGWAIFDRLTVRLALAITLTVIPLLALGLTLLSRHHFRHLLEVRQHAADLQNRLVEAALRHQMLERDDGLIAASLEEVGRQPEVQSAMILDHEGVVRFSSPTELVGQQLSRDSPACLVCHALEPEDREHWTLVDGGDSGDVLRAVRPIENRPECHQCHDASQRVNGILILDVSLSEVRAEQRADAAWMLGGTIVLALAILVSVGLLVRFLILGRIHRLAATARAIAEGDLGARTHERGDDQIARLASDFDDMADAVSRLVAEVRDHEGQLANVMNSLDDGLVVLDRDLLIVASNHAFCRRFGQHPESLRSRRCPDAIAASLPCRPGAIACPAVRCLETGQVQRATFRMPRRDGEAGAVEEVHASPVFDEDGRVARVVEVWRDISERVREEERLGEFERMVSLGVLASGFSHEVNTPLASTLTCAEAILGRMGELAEERPAAAGTIAEIQEYAGTIRSQVLRCRSMTQQFLRFSRGIPPEIELADLRTLALSVVGLATPTAREAKVTIRIEEGEPVPLVSANTEVVQHVLLNILVNAIQSIDGRGGTVVVSFHVGDDVRIRVRDTGCGIAESDRKHLFEPFRSKKPHGTGLGLFLSRSFVRRFGGDVTLLESEVGAGSCFEIAFPRAEAAKP